MLNIEDMYLEMGIRREVYDFGSQIEGTLKERFDAIDKVAEYNQLKVVHAMQKCKVNAGCFKYASGYGYDDPGRDTLEEVYAEIFHTESALVRPQITCGTHALALALAANLRPGDELLSPVGKPYDTLILQDKTGTLDAPIEWFSCGVRNFLSPGRSSGRRHIRL